MTVFIKGAGDLASGIALRLHHCGFQVMMTEIPVPTAVRRTVAFSPAVYLGTATVEDATARLCNTAAEIRAAWVEGLLAVAVDPEAKLLDEIKPDALVDAIIAKHNLGTRIADAPVVVGVGPGFEAGVDCHCVVETKRGHNLGRCIYKGGAVPNTGVPGEIGGYTTQRILRAPCDGLFAGTVAIGDTVAAGQECGTVNGVPMRSEIAGVVRGLLQNGVPVTAGMKSGDVDPRDCCQNCFTVSDKGRAIGGGVLEAILHLTAKV